MMKRISVALLLLCSPPLAMAEDIRLEVKAMPALQRYVDLLAQPGYLAITLENNDLSPSQSSKIKVGENGGSAEIRNAVVRFTGRKGTLFSYEAAYLLGLGDTKVSFPVYVDTSALRLGKVTVTLSPPLAQLIPKELIDRIQLKAQLIANTSAQQKVVNYLDKMSKHGDLIEAVLLDAYNRSTGPMASGGRDVGDAVPLSDQWLLILTLIIWLIVVPVVLLVHRLRRRRAKPA